MMHRPSVLSRLCRGLTTLDYCVVEESGDGPTNSLGISVENADATAA